MPRALAHIGWILLVSACSGAVAESTGSTVSGQPSPTAPGRNRVEFDNPSQFGFPDDNGHACRCQRQGCALSGPRPCQERRHVYSPGAVETARRGDMPLANLYISMMQALSMDVSTFGSVDGTTPYELTMG